MARSVHPPRAPWGTAVERTLLAWDRSALAIVAIAASLLKAGLAADQPALGVGAALILLALAGAVWSVGRRTGREGHAVLASGRRTRMVLLSGAAVFSGAVAFVTAVLT